MLQKILYNFLLLELNKLKRTVIEAEFYFKSWYEHWCPALIYISILQLNLCTYWNQHSLFFLFWWEGKMAKSFIDVVQDSSLLCSGEYSTLPIVVLNFGESASFGTGMMIFTLLAVDRHLNNLQIPHLDPRTCEVRNFKFNLDRRFSFYVFSNNRRQTEMGPH